MSRSGSVRRAGSRRVGLVSLVGAGPGDPDLLTVRAVDRLRRADVVFYDGLTSRRALALASDAERVSVARRVGRKHLTHARVIEMMIDAARAGRRVVRLKSGDPFLLARGGEEVAAVTAAGVPVEVVPGLSTALAAPVLGGIPLTLRGASAGVVVVSGHAPEAYEPVLGRLPPGSATVVVLMGLAARRKVGRCLRGAGWPAATPAAIVLDASRARQRVWTGSLAGLGSRDGITGVRTPGVIVVGDVVAHRAASGRTSV